MLCLCHNPHTQGHIQRKGPPTAEERTIKNKTEILDLLRALWGPRKLAIIHCPGHQKGNNLADRMATEVAMTPVLAPVLVDPGPPALPDEPKYTQEDLAWTKTLPMVDHYKGWWRSANNKVILPKHLGLQVLWKIH